MTTIRQVLFRRESDLDRAARRLNRIKEVKRHREPRVDLVCRSVLNHPGLLLDTEIIDMFFHAWRDRSALRTAARETRATPGLKRRVRLRYYYLPLRHDFDAQITVNGVAFATIPMSLGLDLGVTGLDATVQDGRVSKISGGWATVTAKLSAHNITLVEARLRCRLAKEATHLSHAALA
jgi:hypothetical protein